ncbi:MAG: hypothetical protein BHW64_01735 [Candidatus Melainabacteria bacterium LEY3_CP_29_8]|nr:MAG: hypothetical protein BHW64_01735 [Candidatus Melainabacteria bacterium LEY3_CP_29_8]
MHKDFWGWSLEDEGKGTVETKYLIESITDEKTWSKFLKTEDINLYTKKEYDSIENALEYYLCWYVNENCYDLKMWEQIYVNGEMVLEQMIEPKSTCKSVMRHSIDREMKDRMKQAERKAEELEHSNELYKGFLKAMGKQFEEMFKEYCINN